MVAFLPSPDGNGFYQPRIATATWLRMLFAAILLFASTPAMASSNIHDALMNQFKKWEGVPYQYGGNSRRGIDCSGFVHIIYRQALGLEVPRSTELLATTGHRISRRHLTAGDIILFRINPHTLHAGIYVGEGQFIHASKSRGVMISDLNNPYWDKTYIQASRVLN